MTYVTILKFFCTEIFNAYVHVFYASDLVRLHYERTVLNSFLVRLERKTDNSE